MQLPPLRSTPFGRALRNVGWLLTGKGIGAILSLAYLALAVRSLSLLQFGQFTLILSTAQGVAALVGFQTWQIVIRYGVSHVQEARSPALGRLVRFCLALDAGGALVGCVIAALAIMVMQARLHWSQELTTEALIFCIVLLLSIRSTAVGILRLHDRFALGAVADAVTPIMRLAGATVAVLAGPSVAGFLLAWGLAEIATAAAYWVSASRIAPELLGRWAGAGQTPHDHAGFWRFALASNAHSTLGAATRQFTVVLVGFLAGPVAAGSYRLAYQLSQSLVRVSDMFARGVFPEYARANGALASRQDLQRLFRQSTRLALVAGLVICVLAPLAGGPVLLLVGGQSYLGAFPLLVLLSVAAGLEVMAVGYEPLLVATGRAGLALGIRAVAALVLLVLLALFLSSHGVVVAAVGTLASTALSLILLARAARKAAYPR